MKFFSIIPLLVSVVVATPMPGYPDKWNGKAISWGSATKEIENRWPSGKRDAACIFWSGGGVADKIDTLKDKLGGNAVSWDDVIGKDLEITWNWHLGDANRYYTIQMTSLVFAEQCKGDTVYVFLPAGRDVTDPYGDNRPTTWVSYEWPALTLNANIKEIRRVDPDDIDGTWADDSNIVWTSTDGAQGRVSFPVPKGGIMTD